MEQFMSRTFLSWTQLISMEQKNGAACSTERLMVRSAFPRTAPFIVGRRTTMFTQSIQVDPSGGLSQPALEFPRLQSWERMGQSMSDHLIEISTRSNRMEH